MKKYFNLLYKVKLFFLLLFTVFLYSCCGAFGQWLSIGGSSRDDSEIISPLYEDGAFIDSDGRLVISRFGITWQFDKTYTYGQFVNGDYWVVGPAVLIDIYPRSINVSGRTKHGSMINPSPTQGGNQGYDSACDSLTYIASLNVALNVSISNQLILQNGSSLVSTISILRAGSRPQIKTAAILTVLVSAPPAGSFRPPYSGTDKTINYNVSQLTPLKYNLLKKLTPVVDTPSLVTVEQYFERPWIDHIPGWTCRFIHPQDNMPDYGREIASEIGIGALMLHLDFTNSEKETLLIRYLQLGIDLYGIVQDGGDWEANGGHASGRKWPILFAGIMLDDTGMQNIGQKSGDYLYSSGYGPGNPPSDYINFGEDDQTFYVTTDDVTRTNSVYWDPDYRQGTPAPYTTPDDIDLPDWGIRHAIEPYRDNKDWDANYRHTCTTAWGGYVLAARIMEGDSGTKTLWNHDPVFDYMDRYLAITASNSLPYPDWRSSVTGMASIWASVPSERQSSAFVANMWDTYRDDY